MRRAGSGSRRARGVFWDTTDKLTNWGLQIGALAFAVATIYLMWGVISGALSKTLGLGALDMQRVVQNVQIACRILTIGGILLVVSGVIRYYLDEETGYVLFIVGAVLRWGMPIIVGSSLPEVTVVAATLPAYVAAQYSLVGTVSLVAAVPFLVVDLSRKLRGAKRRASRATMVRTDEEEEIRKPRVALFCWQMPYCRDYLRKFCQAYEKRKACWRIKSGCYCDEDMILRVMKRSSSSKIAGFDQRYSWASGGEAKKNQTAAQKRQRCRECFIYVEHQKVKYRLLSPLSFPATAMLMYVYLRPVKAALHGALELTDKFTGRLSYGAVPKEMLDSQWGSSAAASNTVEWLFLVCLGLVVLTYILRGLEYFIFDLQV